MIAWQINYLLVKLTRRFFCGFSSEDLAPLLLMSLVRQLPCPNSSNWEGKTSAMYSLFPTEYVAFNMVPDPKLLQYIHSLGAVMHAVRDDVCDRSAECL